MLLFFRKILRKIFMSKINELKYTKIRGVKSPVRANPTDAGIDIFVPYDLTKVDMNKMIGMTKCNVRVDTSVSTGCVIIPCTLYFLVREDNPAEILGTVIVGHGSIYSVPHGIVADYSFISALIEITTHFLIKGRKIFAHKLL